MRGVIVEEALHRTRGIAGVTAWYPYVSSTGGQYASLIDDVMAFSRPWGDRLPYEIRWSPLKRRIYQLIGDKQKILWGTLRLAARLQLPLPPVLWKDPFVTLALPYLIGRYGARVACMIRHPGGVYVAMQKRGWPFDSKYLSSQPELMRAYGQSILPAQWEHARTSLPASIAILWKMMVRLTSELASRDDRILLVRHEDLCREPISVTDAIVAHFGLEMNAGARRFLIRCSQGVNVDGKRDRAHDFVRNSQVLADAWRERISPRDEAIMQDIIGDDFYRIYIQW